jgi:D-alanine-D-alanine ligase
MTKKRVAVIFGGTNTEHEISVITALLAMHALKEYGHEVYPIYISKQGTWHLGGEALLKPETYHNLNQVAQTTQMVRAENRGDTNVLLSQNMLKQEKIAARFDVAFPIFHGKYGEDGSIQGLLRLLNVPIAGSTLLSGSVGMDKWLSKQVASSLGIPVLPDVFVTKHQWQSEPKQVLKRISKKLGKEVIVKPSMLGSSIGITLVKDDKTLESGLEVAFTLDERVVVEKLLNKPMEVQISILGNDPYELSVTEQPLSSDEVYSFEDKYIKGSGKKTGATKGMASADRLVPAPISKKQDAIIRSYSQDFYRSIGGKGLSRIDYLIHENKIYFNEINIIPGCLSFYLWEKCGKPFPELMNQVIEMALANYQNEQELVRSFESNVLAGLKLPSSND